MNARKLDAPDHVDPTIRLETRARFERTLAQAAEQVAGGIPQALMAVAVERLVEVRSECGEAAEAALLAIVQRAMHDQLGASARATRLGPDRFAVLRPRCLPRDALPLARRVRTALEGGQFLWHGLSFRVGAYLGVLELSGPETPPADQIAHALRACEGAVALGGDGVVVITGSPGADAALDAETAWREHLREVI